MFVAGLGRWTTVSVRVIDEEEERRARVLQGEEERRIALETHHKKKVSPLILYSLTVTIIPTHLSGLT